jgi:hypothetical protein
MKWSWILLAVECAACSARASESSVTYAKQATYGVPVHVVTIDMNAPEVRVTVAMPKNGRGSSERAASVVSRCQPAAAITGTFFDTTSLLPTGDIVVGGVRVHSGCVGSALCITPDNRAKILTSKDRAQCRGEDFETVLAGGLTLVYGGRVSINPRAEGFSDGALFRPNRRTAVGVTAANKLLLVAVIRPVSLHQLAKIVLRLGATQAMLLDGGSSTAMYAGGRFISSPARRLTNLLVVYESHESYSRRCAQLLPALVLAKQRKAAINLPIGSGPSK